MYLYIIIILICIIIYMKNNKNTYEYFEQNDDDDLTKDVEENIREKNPDNRLNINDLKFIPYSDSNMNNALNSYAIRAKKINNPDLISSVLDANQQHESHHVFEFPYQDKNKSLNDPNFKITKDYHSFFRPIITSSKEMFEKYDKEKELDLEYINDPSSVYMDPKYIDAKILNKPKNKGDTLQTLLTDHKFKHVKRPDTVFSLIRDNGFGDRFKCPAGLKYNKTNEDFPTKHSYEATVPYACDFY